MNPERCAENSGPGTRDRDFPGSNVAGIGAFPRAGFDDVHIAQVGGATEGPFEFYAEQVLPRLRRHRRRREA
jgi:hypothetical protein